MSGRAPKSSKASKGSASAAAAPPGGAVRAWSEPVVLPTYPPGPPDPNPMFLEKRVYQGSSGRVYPNAMTDRISDDPVDRAWQAIHLENDHVRLMILPEIGGRIHAAQDRSNGYDFVYRQHVIKPALVGLLGPWISGGIEFNWPQHHRPSTFMPVDWAIEASADGATTVWLNEHEPMNRMKGMVGVRLRPASSVVELEVRLANRTPFVQTFLWWANIAVRVHDRYQAFFPPDVAAVADHARRAMSPFPIARGVYYGVDYGARPAADADLSWYRNIPVPTSYMAMGSEEDFFGGYDHAEGAGFVHLADHRIAPGKKLWTWGDAEFGHAWNRNLTDADGPYIELMAGVYTDNQPDFSFIAPYETRVFRQYLYPFQRVGPLSAATIDAGVSLQIDEDVPGGSEGRGPGREAPAPGARRAHLGACVSSPQARAVVRLEGPRGRLLDVTTDVAPDEPFVEEIGLPAGIADHELELSVRASDGRTLVSFRPAAPRSADPPLPEPATEPPSPEAVATIEELYLVGLHLEQYRHATRSPEPYWRQGLRRDPGEARCNTAIGRWHLHRGEFSTAESHFRRAIDRLTARNANPADTEAFYHLGLTLQFEDRLAEADDAFAKAAWNRAWQAPASFARARLAGRRGDWAMALEHVEEALASDPNHASASSLRAAILRRLGRFEEAAATAQARLTIDPLDAWAGEELRAADARVSIHDREPDRRIVERSRPFPRPDDPQLHLDIALDLAAGGLLAEAIGVLERLASDAAASPPHPLVYRTLGWLHERAGDRVAASRAFHAGARARRNPDRDFPSRLEEIDILETAARAVPGDARAPYDLGNLLYDRRRYREAIAAWRRSRDLDPGFATVHRNLGIAAFNVLHRPRRARADYLAAVRTDPSDARLLYELDQLLKRLNEPPRRRLARLSARRSVVDARDDLAVEYATLLNRVGQPDVALDYLLGRRFHPWEGGEGLVTTQYIRARLALARRWMSVDRPLEAVRELEAARRVPVTLGEALHPLQSESEVLSELGYALASAGERDRAEAVWREAIQARPDRPSPDDFFRALAHRALGDETTADRLLRELLRDARRRSRTPTRIDYFATSLPTLLLFDEDLDLRNAIETGYLVGLAQLGLGRLRAARIALRRVLELDVSHQGAAAALERLRPGDASSVRSRPRRPRPARRG